MSTCLSKGDYCATFEEILLLRNSTCLYYFFLNYTHLKSVDFEWFWYLYEIYRAHIMLDWVSRAQVYGYEEECGAPLISRDQNLTPSVLKYWGPLIALQGKDWLWWTRYVLVVGSNLICSQKMISLSFEGNLWTMKKYIILWFGVLILNRCVDHY